MPPGAAVVVFIVASEFVSHPQFRFTESPGLALHCQILNAFCARVHPRMVSVFVERELAQRHALHSTGSKGTWRNPPRRYRANWTLLQKSVFVQVRGCLHPRIVRKTSARFARM